MAEHIAKTLADVQAAIAKLEREVASKKAMANQLAELGGLPVPYATIESPEASAATSAVVARDAFVGQPLHTAMRLYLEKRKLAMPNSAPATVNELYAALLDGGYKFDAKNEDNAKRTIRIVLTKNSNTFHKVGNAYGLVVWYGPKVLKKSRKGSILDATENDAEADEEAAAEAEGGSEEEGQE